MASSSGKDIQTGRVIEPKYSEVTIKEMEPEKFVEVLEVAKETFNNDEP